LPIDDAGALAFSVTRNDSVVVPLRDATVAVTGASSLTLNAGGLVTASARAARRRRKTATAKIRPMTMKNRVSGAMRFS
jgi:hypothetical protein